MANTADFSINKIDIVKVEEPLVRMQDERTFVIQEGARDIRYDRAVAQNLSAQSATVNLRLPSKDIAFDRHLYVRATYTVVMTAPAAGGNIIQNELSGPSAYPFSRTCNQMTIQIDGSAFNSQPNRYWPALQRVFSCQDGGSDSFLDYSTTPSMPDQFQNYNDFQTLGSARNPLANYGESFMQSRGGFPRDDSINTPTNATSTFTVTEPLFISPLVWGMASKDAPGLTGATNIQFTFTFDNLAKVWSQNETVKPLTTTTVTLDSLDVLVRYGSFKFSQHENTMLNQINWDYENIYIYQQDVSNIVNAGAQATQSSGAIQLKTIPNRIYVYIQQRLVDINQSIPDRFARIDSVNIQWNAKSGVLSNATIQDLYHLSVKNGLKSSWPQWNSFTGSVLCIDVAKDLGLDSLQAPGVNQDNQLRVDATFTNTSSANQNMVLYVTTISPGVLSYLDGSFYQQLGILSGADVLEAPIDHELEARIEELAMQGGSFSGGSFLTKLKKLGEKVRRGVKKVSPALRSALDIVAPIAEAVAPEFAPGIEAAKRGSELAIKAIGGRRLTDKQKMERLKQLIK